jgi:hypothetical protein
MICYRSRQYNSLYISDVIKVSRKGYGKLQLGLFLAIYRDMQDRASQLTEAALNDTLPESWTRTYNCSIKPSTASPGGQSTKASNNRKKKLSEPERLKLQRVFVSLYFS